MGFNRRAFNYPTEHGNAAQAKHEKTSDGKYAG